jgi:hypothetical protein
MMDKNRCFLCALSYTVCTSIIVNRIRKSQSQIIHLNLCKKESTSIDSAEIVCIRWRRHIRPRLLHQETYIFHQFGAPQHKYYFPTDWAWAQSRRVGPSELDLHGPRYNKDYHKYIWQHHATYIHPTGIHHVGGEVLHFLINPKKPTCILLTCTVGYTSLRNGWSVTSVYISQFSTRIFVWIGLRSDSTSPLRLASFAILNEDICMNWFVSMIKPERYVWWIVCIPQVS